MVELQHQVPPPTELIQFQQAYPNAPVAYFNSHTFQHAKIAVKAALNVEQGGLCVYCEKQLDATMGHVEHIKPKAGLNGRPELCFVYTNYTQSCMTHTTCGQKKSNALLPIEPGTGCNAYWSLSTDGTIEPRVGNTPDQTVDANTTRDILGLNDDADLVDERMRWFDSAYEVWEADPSNLTPFLATAPYRHILSTAF